MCACVYPGLVLLYMTATQVTRQLQCVRDGISGNSLFLHGQCGKRTADTPCHVPPSCNGSSSNSDDDFQSWESVPGKTFWAMEN